MNNECPICEAEGWITDGEKKVCNECDHYDESYHHGYEAKLRRKENVQLEEDRRREARKRRW